MKLSVSIKTIQKSFPEIMGRYLSIDHISWKFSAVNKSKPAIFFELLLLCYREFRFWVINKMIHFKKLAVCCVVGDSLYKNIVIKVKYWFLCSMTYLTVDLSFVNGCLSLRNSLTM